MYASGISESAGYYQILAGIELGFPLLMVEAQGSRFVNYQLTDGDGNYNYAGINEGSGFVTLSPFEFLSLRGGYKYASGDMDYTRKEYVFSAEISGEAISLSSEYSTSKADYIFNDIDVQIGRKDLTVSLSIEITDATGFDLDYDRSSLSFSVGDYDYIRQTVRPGLFHGFNDSLFMMVGLKAGVDSADYRIFGCDAGLVAYPHSRVKITCICLAERFVAPYVESSTVESSTKKGGAVSVSANPYLSSGMIDESYTSFLFSIGAVMTY